VTTTRANQIAVGTSANTYTLAGLPSAASNAAQLGATSFVTTDQYGNLGTASFNPADIAALDGRVKGLESTVADNRAEARGGTALALAAASLRYDDRPDKLSVAGGIGYFKGMTGLSAGIGYATSESFRLNAAISTVPRRGDVGLSAGMSWTLN
jgi:autotransporter adhesin